MDYYHNLVLTYGELLCCHKIPKILMGISVIVCMSVQVCVCVCVFVQQSSLRAQDKHCAFCKYHLDHKVDLISVRQWIEKKKRFIHVCAILSHATCFNGEHRQQMNVLSDVYCIYCCCWVLSLGKFVCWFMGSDENGLFSLGDYKWSNHFGSESYVKDNYRGSLTLSCLKKIQWLINVNTCCNISVG